MTTSELIHFYHGKNPKVNFGTRPFAAKFKKAVKETFFPDDPFRHLYKDDRPSSGKAAWSLAMYFVPMLEWAPKYTLAKFRCDLLAGITISSLAIPQGISYARLADLPPAIGLYSSFVPPLVYVIFGSSMNLAVGTTAASSLLLASIIGSEVSVSRDQDLYVHLFFTATFFTGIFQLALGFFRLGILVDFLSRSTITGFMGGAATIVIMQQLKGFLGLKHFTTKTDIISVIHAVLAHRHEWRWESALLGLSFCAFLLLSKHMVGGKSSRGKAPKLFWLSAMAPLLVVIFGCVFSYLVNAERHGIHIVGALNKGLSPISISKLKLQSQYSSVLVKAALMSGFVALSEGVAVGRSLAMMKNEQIDGNKEMIAFGLMNVVGSWFSCYLTTGPFSKSAVNFHAGCKTSMSNAVMAICMMLVLLFLAPLFKYTPLVALSAVIAVAMIGLIEYKEAYHLFKVDKFDFVICMAAFIVVVFFTITIGLAVSVCLSMLRALLYVARPTTCRLGNVKGTELYCDVEQYPDSLISSEFLIVKLGSPVYYVNASYLKERISRWVEDEECRAKKKGEHLKHVVLDMSGVTSIDNSGIGMLQDVHKNLQRRGIKMALTDPSSEVAEKLLVSNFINRIGEEWIFLSVKEAVTACSITLQESKSNGEAAQCDDRPEQLRIFIEKAQERDV